MYFKYIFPKIWTFRSDVLKVAIRLTKFSEKRSIKSKYWIKKLHTQKYPIIKYAIFVPCRQSHISAGLDDNGLPGPRPDTTSYEGI